MYVHALYETIPRELLSLLLLGRELRSRGVTYEIEQLKLASNRFGKVHDPKLRIVPFCYNESNMRHSISKARWSGEAALNMCWEQFCPAWIRDHFLPEKKVCESMCFTAWGTFYASLLKDKGVAEENIFITGNLRMDLAKHENLLFGRDFLAKTFQLDTNKPWILIAWNLNLGNQKGENHTQQVCDKYGMEFPQEYFDTLINTREAHLKYCAEIAKAFPNHEVILRAHPSGNDAQELKEKIGDKHNNVHAIHDLDIISWITQSESVVSFSSTAMIEAIAAGVPTLSYEPYPFFKNFGYDVGFIPPVANTVDEAISLLKTPQQLQTMINWEEYEKWYGKADHKAHVRLADACIHILNNVDKFRFPAEIARKSSLVKNKTRRLIQNHPTLKPFLSWLGHGTRKRMNEKQWIPMKALDEVIDGAHISRLYPWVSKLK